MAARPPGSVRRRIEFDAETWHALKQLSLDSMKSVQELAEEAFRDLLKKHRRPTTLKEMLRDSVRHARRRGGGRPCGSVGRARRLEPRCSRGRGARPLPRKLRLHGRGSGSAAAAVFRTPANCRQPGTGVVTVPFRLTAPSAPDGAAGWRAGAGIGGKPRRGRKDRWSTCEKASRRRSTNRWT
jgi:hypothetical protein